MTGSTDAAADAKSAEEERAARRLCLSDRAGAGADRSGGVVRADADRAPGGLSRLAMLEK